MVAKQFSLIQFVPKSMFEQNHDVIFGEKLKARIMERFSISIKEDTINLKYQIQMPLGVVLVCDTCILTPNAMVEPGKILCIVVIHDAQEKEAFRRPRASLRDVEVDALSDFDAPERSFVKKDGHYTGSNE
ncbi:hypothetical protein VNO77_02760 [Canavalia gladiata]|uniref:Uncharacterized protein n=1 Tax=Canavalia gladiata TaxID=3824 RepID=A0AAN9MUC4_CANGL